MRYDGTWGGPSNHIIHAARRQVTAVYDVKSLSHKYFLMRLKVKASLRLHVVIRSYIQCLWTSRFWIFVAGREAPEIVCDERLRSHQIVVVRGLIHDIRPGRSSSENTCRSSTSAWYLKQHCILTNLNVRLKIWSPLCVSVSTDQVGLKIGTWMRTSILIPFGHTMSFVFTWEGLNQRPLILVIAVSGELPPLDIKIMIFRYFWRAIASGRDVFKGEKGTSRAMHR